MIPNKSQGYYFGSYEIVTSQYMGANFSRRCFIFPGQGSASPGMFKEHYLNFESIRIIFDKADSLAEKNKLQKVSDYILHPENIKKNDLPMIRNLALFTMEVALYKELISKINSPEIITGHSFGEYASLVACGIMTFEDVFDIVYHRDLFCPKANFLGFMIAVGASENEIIKALRGEDFYISNKNSFKQVVVAVSPDNINKIETRLRKENLRFKVLTDVPQPYHCPYLNDVKDEMEKFI